MPQLGKRCGQQAAQPQSKFDVPIPELCFFDPKRSEPWLPVREEKREGRPSKFHCASHSLDDEGNRLRNKLLPWPWRLLMSQTIYEDAKKKLP